MVNSTPPVVNGARPGVGHIPEFLRDPIGLVERGHREHGNVFALRLGNRAGVFLIGPEHHRFFFDAPEDLLSIRSAYPFFNKMFDEDFYFFGEPDEYARQRAVLEAQFTGAHRERQIALMADDTRAFLATVGDEGTFDITFRLGPLVMRMAAHCFLGEDLGVFLGYDFFGEFRRFSDGMEPVLPLWLPLPRLIGSRKARRRLRDRLGALVRSRRDHPVQPPDFLQVLVDDQGRAEDPLPEHVLVNLVLLLMWAGQETVTGHLSWAIIDLLQNPKMLSAVRAELADVFGDDDEVNFERLSRLQLLDQALEETGRLHPVAHILMRRAHRPIEHCGFSIAEGTMIFVAPCVAHRLPEIFPEPDEYRPERHAALGVSSPRDDDQLITFGAGHHRCPGRDFARLEMKVVLSLLLAHLELELVDTEPKPEPGPKVKWPASPCRVRYRRR